MYMKNSEPSNHPPYISLQLSPLYAQQIQPQYPLQQRINAIADCSGYWELHRNLKVD